MNSSIDLSFMVQELVDAGELIRRGDEFYEDMGGHLIHERSAPEYFWDYVDGLSESEKSDLLKRCGL